MDSIKDTYDVIVIGAGIAGSAVARELTKFKLKIGVLEKNIEVGFGVTKGTHAIVHNGIPTSIHRPRRNRAQLRGCLIMEQLCKDLDVKFNRIGKLLVAFDEKSKDILSNLEVKCKRNGLIEVELITDIKRLKEMEPNISDKIIAALYTKNTGVVSPWELTHGLIENAIDNGVKLHVDSEVKSITKDKDGKFILETASGSFKSEYVINAAGLYADDVAAFIGDKSFELENSRQQRIILDKNCRNQVRHLVRAVNSSGGGSDFVCPTVYGDIMVGVKSEPEDYKGDVKTTREGIEEHIIPKYLELIPSLLPSNIIRPFAGDIAQVKGRKDYHIKPYKEDNKFVNFVLGGEGLTCSYPMAEYLVNEVMRDLGLKLEENKEYNPIRKSIPRISELTNEERARLIEKDPRYGHIVCRCETISEGEIVEAIRRGARTRDGVKFRTRAGMGRCQGGFCGPRVIAILARELNIPAEEVTRKGKGSEEILYKAKEFLIHGFKEDAK
jgi:glycerol-3-phosphate dehydrogenase